MKVAITGATGFVGSHLTKFLVANGHTVIPLGRAFFADGAESQLLAAVNRADAVVNLAGAPIAHRWTDSYKQLLYSSRITLTTKLATTSEVDVILNISSNVSVMNSRTRVSGIMRGDGKGRLYVDYYDRLDDVRVGDVFVTSGLGMLYPKGIRIGKVSEIVRDNTGLFQKVFIEQSEDFYKLEHVFVVKNNSK